MLTNWSSIPFGIVVVIVAGGALNLVPYFLELKDQLGFETVHQEFIRWGVLFGYYGGILAGPMIDIIGSTFSFLIAAIISGLGFVALAFYTDASSVGTFNAVIIVTLVLTVSFACAIATIAAIAAIIKNFSRRSGAMVAAVMISYYFAARYFDTSIRNGYFESLDMKTNMLVSAGIHFSVYMLGAMIIGDHESNKKLKKASILTDKLGILVYAVIAGLFLAVVYTTCIVTQAYRLSIILITLIVLVNFVALVFIIQGLLLTIERTGISEVRSEYIPPKKSFGKMLVDKRYLYLLVSTFIIIGTGTTYYLEASDVAEDVGKPELADKVDYAYWLSAVLTILVGGMCSAMFNNVINAWLLAAIACFASTVGFALVFLSVTNDFFYYMSAFFVGAGTGGFWVVVPQLVLDDAGPKSFKSLWGFTLSVNAAGMFIFDAFFWWVSEKTDPDKAGNCQGSQCYVIIFVGFAAVCFVAGVLCLSALDYDRKLSKDEERRPLRSQDSFGSFRRNTFSEGKKGEKDKKGRPRSSSKSKNKK
ncbi:unnamed protein product [Moneuplotes crassus]|uniref:Uncharacterized protein n=1 Tax=Euplotes crassus TaxID=5936 RepID=A0AAD1UGT3_EUPCR|nr:unnamed protein product [Moneuplotes crassus]